MKEQRERARTARLGEDHEGWEDDGFTDISQDITTDFKGYETLETHGKVLAIIKDNAIATLLSENEEGILILDKTAFYGESGGQVGDVGIIYGNGFNAKVIDTKVGLNDRIHHSVKVEKGNIKLDDIVTTKVDENLRMDTARNHTATHLLHKALKEVIGEHVQQAGSLVTPTRLRFDFTHFEAVSKEELQKIESIVNEKINYFLPVKTQIMTVEEAKKSGAIALFDEKYGEKVRVVSVGDYSTELCGGTHITNSGQIGAFRIISENGIAAGVRRIEAITGASIYKKLRAEEELINSAAEALKTNAAGLLNKINLLNDEYKASKKELDELKKQTMSAGLDDMIANAPVINEVRLITHTFKDYDINDLRSLSDDIRAKIKSVIIVFATENNNKVTFMVSVSDDLLEKGYHAGNMIKKIAAAAGGGGGGKADMAQAGAKDPTKIQDALDVAATLIS